MKDLIRTKSDLMVGTDWTRPRLLDFTNLTQEDIAHIRSGTISLFYDNDGYPRYVWDPQVNRFVYLG